MNLYGGATETDTSATTWLGLLAGLLERVFWEYVVFFSATHALLVLLLLGLRVTTGEIATYQDIQGGRMTPEEKARESIDALLIQAGWKIQNVKDVNIHAGRGVAINAFRVRCCY